MVAIEISIKEAGYTRDKPIIEDIDLTIDHGESILITGSSGSGKTTLLLAITGVLNNLLGGYVEGSVDVSGINPLEMDGFKEIPKHVGVVLQDPDKQLAMPKVLDEVLFTLENFGYDRDESIGLANKHLSWVGLWEKRDYHVEDLSGGEKRRLTIASALVHNPEIILLDEVTASMDPWGVENIRSFIRENSSDKAVVIIDHKARYFLDLVDRVYVMNDGSLMEVQDAELLDNYGVDVKVGRRMIREGSYKDGLKIRISNLSIGYDTPISRSISFEAYGGEVIAVIGPNGVGKSTLLKTLAGFIKPLSGSIERFGDVFYVPQAPDNLFMFRSVEEEIVKSFEKAGHLTHDVNSLLSSAGIDVSASPYRLSHGQRRLLANIIASIYSKDIILLDEPTTGLDLNLYLKVASQIRDLADRGRAVIIATHDVRLLYDVCDRVFIMDSEFKEVELDKAIKYLETPVNLNEV